MLDQTQWPRGKQFTVVGVTPPPEGQPYVLQQVILVPRREHEPQFSLWCEARPRGAALLQEQNVVVVTGTTLSSVSVKRLVQEVPDGLPYLLIMPPVEEPDSMFERMHQQVITILALNTSEQMLTWQYILVAYSQLEAFALELLRLHEGIDEQSFWGRAVLPSLNVAANKLGKNALAPQETIQTLLRVAKLRNSVAHKQLLYGMTTYARYDDNPVFDAEYVTKSLRNPEVPLSGVNEETLEQLLTDVHRAQTELNRLREAAARK